ncbi:MAG: divalent-cation tolerance protein CutA [Chlamydiales bacterium]
MSELIEVHWTTGNIDEARKISRYLVKERIVASSQIIPWIESVYMWDNQLETTQESKIVMKTVKENFNRIQQVIYENCSYEVPEIIQFSIQGGNTEFLGFIEENSQVFEEA